MTEHFDPTKILEDLNPVGPDDVRGVAGSSEARATLRSILGQAATQPSWRQRSHRLRIAAAAAAAVAALAGTAWALTRSAPQHLTIGCYATQSTSAHTVVVPAGSGPPVATCRTVWQRGDFGAVGVPQLQACVLPSGGIAVFPGAHPCTTLKLRSFSTRPTGSGQTEQSSAVKLKDHLVRDYLRSRCLSRARGLHLARAEIQGLHLRGWRVHVSAPFTRQRSCTSFAFDEQHMLVLIVPVPPR
jgi:hypothetical protein